MPYLDGAVACQDIEDNGSWFDSVSRRSVLIALVATPFNMQSAKVPVDVGRAHIVLCPKEAVNLCCVVASVVTTLLCSLLMLRSRSRLLSLWSEVVVEKKGDRWSRWSMTEHPFTALGMTSILPYKVHFDTSDTAFNVTLEHIVKDFTITLLVNRDGHSNSWFHPPAGVLRTQVTYILPVKLYPQLLCLCRRASTFCSL